MTKPLTFVLELAGAIFIFWGIVPLADPFKIGFGAVIFLIGAYGIRKRMKRAQ